MFTRLHGAVVRERWVELNEHNSLYIYRAPGLLKHTIYFPCKEQRQQIVLCRDPIHASNGRMCVNCKDSETKTKKI